MGHAQLLRIVISRPGEGLGANHDGGRTREDEFSIAERLPCQGGTRRAKVDYIDLVETQVAHESHGPVDSIDPMGGEESDIDVAPRARAVFVQRSEEDGEVDAPGVEFRRHLLQRRQDAGAFHSRIIPRPERHHKRGETLRQSSILTEGKRVPTPDECALRIHNALKGGSISFYFRRFSIRIWL